MSCEKIREIMPDVAAGSENPTPEMTAHLHACNQCAETLDSMKKTMALLDEWQAPEPSPYFNTRLQARLREVQSEPQKASWLAWFRRPVLGIAAVGLLAFGAAFLTGDRWPGQSPNAPQPTVARGTAVGDLQFLDKQSDLLQDFDAIDSSPDDDSAQVN